MCITITHGRYTQNGRNDVDVEQYMNTKSCFSIFYIKFILIHMRTQADYT